MPRLVIVTRYFPPTSIVGAIRPFRLAKHAADAGWEVDVIHGPHDFNTIESSATALLSNRVTLHSLGSSSERAKPRNLIGKAVRRIESAVIKMLGSDSDWRLSREAASQLIELLDKRPGSQVPTVLVTSSPPHSLQSAGFKAVRARRTPWIVDLRDPWDKFTTTAQYTQPNGLERGRENAAMTLADAVVSTTPGYTDVLRNRYPDLPREKFVTITNSYATAEDAQPAVPDPGILTIAYTGIFYPEKDPYTFFRAVAHWIQTENAADRREISSRLRIQLIGTEDRVTPTVVSSLGLDDVVEFIPRVPQHVARRYCQAADFLLVAPGLTDSSRTGWLPSKVFEYLSCRRPIIAVCKEGQLAELIRQTHSGHVFQEEDPGAIIALLSAALAEKQSTGALGTPCTFEGIEAFSETNMARKFLSLADELLQRQR